MRPFDRLYFDSNILMREKWPRPSPSITKLSQVAAELGVSLHLPEGVEIELEENWLREVKERHKSTLLYVTGVVDAGNVILPEPNWEEVRGGYRATVQAAKTGLRMSSVLLTPHALAGIFRLSACRDAPFHPFQNEDKRIGLQDAAIYLSIVEDLRSSRETGAFLTDDSIFEDKGLAELASIGVALKRFRDIESLQKALEQGLDQTRKRRLAEDQQRTIESFEQRKTDLAGHIAKNFNPQLSYWFIPNIGTVTEIDRIELGKIQNVQTPYPPVQDSSGRVDISAEVEVFFYARVDESSAAYGIAEIPASGLSVLTLRPKKQLWVTTGFTTLAMPTTEYQLTGLVPSVC